jgi:hypothetical protein
MWEKRASMRADLAQMAIKQMADDARAYFKGLPECL